MRVLLLAATCLLLLTMVPSVANATGAGLYDCGSDIQVGTAPPSVTLSPRLYLGVAVVDVCVQVG